MSVLPINLPRPSDCSGFLVLVICRTLWWLSLRVRSGLPRGADDGYLAAYWTSLLLASS